MLDNTVLLDSLTQHDHLSIRVTTDLNNHTGVNKASDSAKIIAHYAMLDADGPSGQFFNAAGIIRW